MKANVKFLGTTSSGKAFKYEVYVPEPDTTGMNAGDKTNALKEFEEKKAALAQGLKTDGVTLNENLGVPVGFISQTHLHTLPKEGDVSEVDIRGYYDDRADRKINWFADIDKAKQKNFAEKQQLTAEVRSIVNVENTLTDLNSSLDVERFEKVRLLKLQQKKLSREIELMGVA